MTIFVDRDQVLAEKQTSGHMDDGHTVLEQKPRQAGGWGLGPCPPPGP